MAAVGAAYLGAGQTISASLSVCWACLGQSIGRNQGKPVDWPMHFSVRPIKEM